MDLSYKELMTEAGGCKPSANMSQQPAPRVPADTGAEAPDLAKEKQITSNRETGTRKWKKPFGLHLFRP